MLYDINRERGFIVQTLMIADSSTAFSDALEAAFRDRYRIIKAFDGNSAFSLLQEYQPEVAIINLLLPYKDGLTLLQQSAFQPHIILALTNYMSAYVQQAVTDLGIDYTMIMPSAKTVIARLEDLLRNYSPQSTTMHAAMLHYLQLLNIPTHLDGYRQLCIAIPLFAANPNQFLTKELYPEVAKRCGCKDGRLVEHSIRKAIRDAWQHRDIAVWRKYFPVNAYGNHSCPSNKIFLCVLAELLNNEGAW